MTEPMAALLDYHTRTVGIKAAEVDAQWLHWLTKEKGYTKVNIGDYYLIGNDGEQVMPKTQFERLFIRP